MSHYKSNVRDQVFNLFEVFGVDKALGEGEYADLDADTAREMLGEMGRLAEGPIAESFADGDRNPPVFDPKTHTRDAARVVQEVGARRARRRLGQARPRRGARRHADAPRAACGPCIEHVLGANPAAYMYAMGAGFAQHLLQPRHRRAEEVGRAGRRARLGRRPWCSPSPTPAPTSAPAAPRPSSRTTAPGTSTA